MGILARLASLKLTALGMVLLLGGAILLYGNPPDISALVVVVPLLILSVNLMAAIITNRKINRQPGLLVFHLGLLAVVLLAAVGRLTHLNAQVEVVEGGSFEPFMMKEVRKGMFHPWRLDQVHFVQGPYSVSYDKDLQRKRTLSTIMYRTEDGQDKLLAFGDDDPFLYLGYRFYSSFNKGYSPILMWIPDKGAPVVGSVNMPSYPLYDYKQKNSWLPPGQKEPVQLWLKLKTAMDTAKPWVMEGRTSSGTLAVTYKDTRVELAPGQSVKLHGGTLRYERLSMWMGYTVFFDPTLQWMFFASVIGALGMGWQLWQRTSRDAWKS